MVQLLQNFAPGCIPAAFIWDQFVSPGWKGLLGGQPSEDRILASRGKTYPVALPSPKFFKGKKATFIALACFLALYPLLFRLVVSTKNICF